MLVNSAPYKHVVLVGATSEIGLAIVDKLAQDEKLHITLIGRRCPAVQRFNTGNVVFIKCDLEDAEEVEEVASQISTLESISVAIVAAGILPPENSDLDLKILKKTLTVNSLSTTLFLAALTQRLENQSFGKLIYISTVAAVRPRIRNFAYGASKVTADFYAIGLRAKYKSGGTDVHVLRPGYVRTRMSNNFRPAPFATDVETVARITVKMIHGNQRVIYTPRILRLIFIILKLLPYRLFSRL